MNEKFKKMLPIRLKKAINKVFNTYMLLSYYYGDFNRYSKSAYFMNEKSNKNKLRAKITINYHSIEKGLSHKNPRLGFGQQPMNLLLKSLSEYKKLGYSTQDIRYQTGISTIQEYIELHKENNFEVSELENKFNQLRVTERYNNGGALSYKKEKILEKRLSNFAILAKNRVSVREFSEDPVNIDDINEALDIAMKTPSVCNRQPWKVFVIKNKETKNKVLNIQGGFRGFGENVDTLLVLCSDNYNLSGPTERNQGFIDTGMFSMSLAYALEYKGLATCFLNAALNKKKDKAIRTLLNIQDNHNIVLFIAVGNYPDYFKAPKSQRDDFKEIVEYVM
ncbi:nitroreductase family protein [Salinicoccus roseus]|uniref:nitroreductase family protein n=1 Tax=Salinicoccus roseus TaxID=45670 RepID=UPI001CA70120|nr:nitroreductase family protein [Salinicoccus roseus]MBY8908372.1 nitroreductase family protein [Salinicoccus roseus]